MIDFVRIELTCTRPRPEHQRRRAAGGKVSASAHKNVMNWTPRSTVSPKIGQPLSAAQRKAGAGKVPALLRCDSSGDPAIFLLTLGGGIIRHRMGGPIPFSAKASGVDTARDNRQPHRLGALL